MLLPGCPPDGWDDYPDPPTPPSLTVYPSDSEAVGTILGPDGLPLHTVLPARIPFGFCRPAQP